MRKTIFIMLLIVWASMTCKVCAQTPSDSTATNRFIYCELISLHKLFSTKVMISVDYGQETRFLEDTTLKDEQTGKSKLFNSIVDALNYMGKEGWEFVQSYVLTNGDQKEHHWLLKKKVTSREIQ